VAVVLPNGSGAAPTHELNFDGTTRARRTKGACKGHVIDHIMPLKRGGADNAENMQWQSKVEAAAKDRRE
jgi:hypothetical protein